MSYDVLVDFGSVGFRVLYFWELIGVLVGRNQPDILYSGYICYGEEFLYRSCVLFPLRYSLPVLDILFTNSTISVFMVTIFG